MSYSRKYNETISELISKRLAVTYSTDKDGKLNKIEVEIDNKTHSFSGRGSKTIDISAKIPVTVEIELDTHSFDSSVEDCNKNVNLLTGAVVATEAAQIASINKNSKKIATSIDVNSKKIANTIITGFFGLIRSEISQQIAELTQGIDSQLMHLRELSKAVVDKKRQMEGDFLRISSRYTKTFEDLNNELSNRIFQLDKSAFVFKKELDNQNIRTTNNDLVNTVTVFGQEGSELQSKISASIAKKRALDTLTVAKVFLWQQKKLNNTIQQSMLNDSTESLQYSPICFIETKADKNQLSKGLHSPSFVSSLQENQTKNELIEQFNESTNEWVTITKDYTDNLKLYFNSELNNAYNTADQHSVRVKEMIQKITNLSSIQTICV